METTSVTGTSEVQRSQHAEHRWMPSWRIRWSLKAKKWFPIFAQVATVVISIAALYVITMQARIYDAQRKLMMETKTVMAEQTDIIRVAERSYVGVHSVTADLKERQIILMFENVGRIPADNIKVEVWEARRKMGKNSPGSISHITGQRLFPGSLRMQVVIPLSDFHPTEISDIAERKEKLYVMGKIEYEDGFGNQTTEFGFEYKPPPNEGWTARSDLIMRK